MGVSADSNIKTVLKRLCNDINTKLFKQNILNKLTIINFECFQDPIVDYTLPIKQLANWFDEIVVTRKREEISNLLKTLMHKYNPDSHHALPDITFPTLNGK